MDRTRLDETMLMAFSTSATPAPQPTAPEHRAMKTRGSETRLARATLLALLFYFPVETWASWRHEYWLLNPFYIVDLVAMGLLLYGASRSLQARPRSTPGALCAAYAWTAANGWRATWGRAFELRDGGQLDHGLVELWVVGGATLLSLLCLAWSFHLMVRADDVRE
jgi:hypothetical protein